MTTLSNSKITRAAKKLSAVKESFRTLIKHEQTKCKHEDIAEASDMSGAPVRICLSCGLSEEGWGSGYTVLTCEMPRKISSEKLRSLRVGPILYQGSNPQTKFLRKEITKEEYVQSRW